MSHEIRTPMNGVIGMAELMLETDLDRDQRLYTETITKSGAALLTIINDILDFSKIEAGKMTLDPEPFNLQRALEDIVTLVTSKAVRNNVEVSLRYDPDLPFAFKGDAGRIRQIVTNIVGNAVKFTHDGQVIVNASGRPKGKVFEIIMEITDTGVGIPDSNLTSIFQEFEQVDGAANRKFEGTGLGLAISTRLIRMIGGRIEVRSELGKGSTFTIQLPLKTTSSLVETSFDLESDLTGKHILVVDDLEINRTILSEQLRNWNATFEVAESAQAALNILETAATKSQQFDLVVLDFQMPGIDGFELAKQIRAREAFADMPMILLSSVEQTAEVKSQKEFGFAEILMKPARSLVLKSAILGALKIEKKPNPVKKPKPAVLSTNKVTTAHVKLLVAEDNKTNQLVVQTMLKQALVDLKIAQNGVEAKDLYLSFKPEMVLMDMSMPEMDGLQATREIRLLEAELNLTRCPIIALTANAMKGDRDLCLNAGMDDYLSKPIVKAKLLEALEKWQPESRSVPGELAPGSVPEREGGQAHPSMA